MKILIVLALLFIWLAISTWLGRRFGTFLDDGEDDEAEDGVEDDKRIPNKFSASSPLAIAFPT